MMPSLANQAPGAEIEETRIFLRLMWIGRPPKADIHTDGGFFIRQWMITMVGTGGLEPPTSTVSR